MPSTPFPIDPVLTGITLAYRNQALIADAVLPRLAPLAKQEFKWNKWNKEEGYTIPNTLVGRKSIPNEVEFHATEETASTEDYALDDVIPLTDEDNAAGTVDPRGRATEGLTDLIALDRERRVAGIIQDPATYPAGNQIQLTGGDQWSDYTSGQSDPIGDITTGMDLLLLRPNVAVMSQPVWTKLRGHPDIAKAIHGTSGDRGLISRQQFLDLFELERLEVGQSFLNSAPRNQPGVFDRVWGKDFSLLHLNPRATQVQANEVTFGFTAQYRDRVSGSIDEPKVGMRGSTRVRVGESLKEIVSASDVGYFIQDAIA